MSAAIEETGSAVANQSKSVRCGDARVNEEMPQDVQSVADAESSSNNDQPSVGSSVIGEPEITNVSSEASNSSQGLQDF